MMLLEAYNDFYKVFKKDLGDRSGTVGASEIGQCARQTFWRKNEGTRKGVRRDEDFEEDWGASIRGIIMEFAFWVPALRKAHGDKLLYAGTEQQKLTKGYLSCTSDGLLIDQPYDLLKHLGVKNIKSGDVAAECKTIDPRTNLVEAKETNIYQVVTQLGLYRDCTPHKPEYGWLTYTDASFWSEVDEFAIKFDQFMYDAAHVRAKEIITAKSGQELAPEGWISGGKECSFCPFVGACGVARGGVPRGNRKASPQFVAEMTDIAMAYNKAKIAVAKIEKEMKTVEVEIKQRLKSKGVNRIDNVLHWYKVGAPVRYQNKEIREAFIELGGDPEEFTKTGQPSDRLVIAATPAASRVVKSKTKRRSPAKGPKKPANNSRTKTQKQPVKTKAKAKSKTATRKTGKTNGKR